MSVREGASKTQSPAPVPPGTEESGEPRASLSTLQWIALAVGVAVFVTACISLGRWQFSRHEARDEVIATIVENYDSQPRELSSFVRSVSDPLPASEVWAVAQLEGEYLPQYTALLRNRPINSTPSVHVLVPFAMDNGRVILVNRGWVPYDNGVERPSRIPEPPSGQVTITVHLRATEPSSSKDAPSGQVQAINVEDAFAAGAHYAALPELDSKSTFTQVYGSLRSETPEPQEPVNSLPRPSTDPKSHLSYAMQWWVFALGGLAGFVVLIVREVRKRRPGVAVENNPFAQLARQDSDEPSFDSQALSSSRQQRRRSQASMSEEDYEDSLFSDDT